MYEYRNFGRGHGNIGLFKCTVFEERLIFGEGIIRATDLTYNHHNGDHDNQDYTVNGAFDVKPSKTYLPPCLRTPREMRYRDTSTSRSPEENYRDGSQQPAIGRLTVSGWCSLSYR